MGRAAVGTACRGSGPAEPASILWRPGPVAAVHHEQPASRARPDDRITPEAVTPAPWSRRTTCSTVIAVGDTVARVLAAAADLANGGAWSRSSRHLATALSGGSGGLATAYRCGRSRSEAQASAPRRRTSGRSGGCSNLGAADQSAVSRPSRLSSLVLVRSEQAAGELGCPRPGEQACRPKQHAGWCWRSNSGASARVRGPFESRALRA